MALQPDVDVVLVGAGPTGLVLSLLLARRGHRVALLERWPEPYPQPRAIGLNHEALRVLRQAGTDARVEQVLQNHDWLKAAEYLTPDGEVLVSMPIRAMAESGWPEMQGFNQPDVEAYLEELTNESPRIKVMRNVIVTGIDQSADGAVVHYRSGDGKSQVRADAPPRCITGRFVVGCDGANSFVSSHLGLPRTDLDFSSDWLVVDIKPHDMTGEWTLSPFLAEVLDHHRPTTVAPSGPGRRRFEFMLRPGEDRAAMSTPEAAWSLLAAWKVTPENADLVRSVVYRFRAHWLDEWRQGRVLIAGDAAHLMPPFLAQGFNSCIRDAANLSMYLDLVLKDLVPLERLDRYTEERLPHVRTMIHINVMLGRQICITDPVAAQARDDELRALRDSGQTVGVSTLTLEAGTLADDDLMAGTLSHQGRVEHEGRTGWFDDLCVNGRFVLIGTDGDPAMHLSPAARALWSRLDGAAFHLGDGSALRDVDGTYANWLKGHDAAVVLVRPDYYVFGSGVTAADADRLVLDLGRKLGLTPAPADAGPRASSRAAQTALA
jgi:2-polyprenyl-6-methoxyphenol hydroxylase-like FAD-dependent oxidoreductase